MSYMTYKTIEKIIGDSTRISDFKVTMSYRDSSKHIRYRSAKDFPFTDLHLLHGINYLKLTIVNDYKTSKNMIRLAVPESEDGNEFSDEYIGLHDLGLLIVPGLGGDSPLSPVPYTKVRLRSINNTFEDFECSITSFKLFANMIVKKIEFDIPGITVYVDTTTIKATV